MATSFSGGRRRSISWRPVLVVEEAGVQYFSYIMATSFSGGRSRRTTDHGQATGKLYRLLMQVVYTFFVIYKAGREPMPY